MGYHAHYRIVRSHDRWLIDMWDGSKWVQPWSQWNVCFSYKEAFDKVAFQQRLELLER